VYIPIHTYIHKHTWLNIGFSCTQVLRPLERAEQEEAAHIRRANHRGAENMGEDTLWRLHNKVTWAANFSKMPENSGDVERLRCVLKTAKAKKMMDVVRGTPTQKGWTDNCKVCVPQVCAW
jgi:hypothetical protein